MSFLGGAFKVGRLFGVNIRIHVLFVIWIALRLVSSGGDFQSTLLFLGMLFGIILLHEFGHCFGARAVGGDAYDIMMWPLGGLAYAHAPMRPWPQFVTVAAGPLVNVVLCSISGAILLVLTRDVTIFSLNPLLGIKYRFGVAWVDLLATFYCVNYFLLAFNLLPIYPLDGGQLFQATIWPLVGLQRATLIACQVGLVGCVILGVLAIQGSGAILFFIAIFGGFTCWQRLQAARYGMVVEDPSYTRHDAELSGRGFFSRIFKTRRRSRPRASGSPIEFPNPNPGGWKAKQERQSQTEDELDGILKKVSEHGIRSLSYVERQKLERITRDRQTEENGFQRNNRV